MSVLVPTRGEAGGSVAAHLQCPACGHFSKSHAHQLSHVAAAHPALLDDVVVGRLGNILTYQSTARLFHCSGCFFTSKDFTKLYKHVICRHCVDEKEGGGAEEEGGGGEEKEEEEEGGKDSLTTKRSSEDEEKEEEGGKDSLTTKRSSEDEEEEEGGVSVKPDGVHGEDSALMFDRAGYHCLICGWKNRMKVLSINHVMRKHDIPRAYAAQAIKRDAATASGAEDDDVAGLSGELLKEEMMATAKVVSFTANRFVCLICGWKAKLKGFTISHVARCHDVERPYVCRSCGRRFFLPSRLQQHVRAAHRPGRYACPFCCFRSHYLGGFRRHCSRCNAREEEGGEGVGGAGAGAGREEQQEGGERRGGRKRRAAARVMEDNEEQDEEQ